MLAESFYSAFNYNSSIYQYTKTYSFGFGVSGCLFYLILVWQSAIEPQRKETNKKKQKQKKRYNSKSDDIEDQ